MNKVKVDVFNNGNHELPKYSTELSAGFDIKSNLGEYGTIYMGNGKWDIHQDGHITLQPNGRILIPTGLYIAIPDNYELQIRPRSGLALKHGITVLNSPGTIDCDYRGELCVLLINTDQESSFDICNGDRIGQGVLNRVEQVIWNTVDSIESLGETERGQGGFGHTGSK